MHPKEKIEIIGCLRGWKQNESTPYNPLDKKKNFPIEKAIIARGN